MNGISIKLFHAGNSNLHSGLETWRLPSWGSLKGLTMIATPWVKDLDLKRFCLCNFHGQETCQKTKADTTNGLSVTICKLVLCKSHGRAQLEYCRILLSDTLRAGWLAIKIMKGFFSVPQGV